MQGKNIRDEDIAEVLGLIDRKILNDTIEAIASKDVERCMEIIETVYHFGYDLQHFCRELLQYLRNLILIKVSQHPEGLMELPEEELEIFKKQAEKFQFDQLNHLFSLLLKGEQEIAQSTFPRTMLEMTLIRMATLQPILPVDEMMKKLEALENKEPPKGGKEKKNSPAMGKVTHSTDSERDKEKGEASPKKPGRNRARERFLKKGRILKRKKSLAKPLRKSGKRNGRSWSILHEPGILYWVRSWPWGISFISVMRRLRLALKKIHFTTRECWKGRTEPNWNRSVMNIFKKRRRWSFQH